MLSRDKRAKSKGLIFMTYHDTAVGLAGAVALCVFAAGASAETVNLTFKSPSTGGAISDGPQVNITSVPTLSPGAKTGNTYAFGFNMNGGDPLGDFLAWCLDLQNTLDTNKSRPYKITNTPFDNTLDLSVSERGDRIQAVFDANYGGLDAGVGNEAAGFQLALWEALYDDDWDLGKGDFQASASIDITTKANTYLTAAKDYKNGEKRFDLTFFESTGTGESQRQNLVSASPVPLPASVLLLLGGIGGLGSLSALRRRTRTA